MIEKIALKEKLDWILVYGDTNSTLAGAISLVSFILNWHILRQVLEALI